VVSINYNCTKHREKRNTKRRIMSIAIDATKQQTVSNCIAVEEVTCGSTLKACALLTADAICCIPCCMCFGGCCGKYEPFAASAFSDLKTEPGQQRFGTVCLVQCMAAMFMPFTLCGCCWACCGTCTPCATGVFNMVKSNDAPAKQTSAVTKPPTDQEINREILDFTNNFLAGK
jgi:hypothetical protein